MRLDQIFGPTADISAMMQRMRTMMEQEGLPFGENRFMTYNSRLAQELAKWGENTDKSEELITALYHAYFVHGKNIGDEQVLLEVVEQVGLPAEEAREILQQRLFKDAVDEDWHYARSIGVTAVPTFAVGLTGVVGAQPYEQLARLVEHGGAEMRK